MYSRNLVNKSVLFFCLLIWSIQTYGAGLPGEFLLTQRWRDMIATHSPVNNPALMVEENYLSARMAFAPILNGAFKHGEVGLTIPIGLYQSAGLTFLFSPEGTVQQGTIISDGNIVAASSGTSNSNYLIMASYAYHFWNRLSAGVNLNASIQTAFGDPAWGIGFDLGLTYRLIRHPVIGDHLLGVSTINLLAPQMNRENTDNGEGALSKDLKFSWIANYWEKRFESAVDFDIKDFWAAASDFNGENGVNIAKKLEWDVNFKVGAWLLRLLKMYLQLGFDEDALDYWGMAFGVNAPSVNNGRDLEIIYQYNIMTEKDNDATGHTIYARVDFGLHREEIFARRVARLASLSPNELYNKARKLYSEKKYWDAFFIFSRIVVEFPDFFKNDWVEYYRSSCQEMLDMREVAIKNFEKMKTEYSKSSAVAHADLGMMRVYYRNAEYGKVANQYIELNKPNVPDSLKYHGSYLMGESYLQVNEFEKAIQALIAVPDTHPDYVYAQHAIAVARALLDQNTSDIVTALENCIATKPVDEAQKEMVNRSYLFLGYIFYEENTVSKAVVALRMIPPESFYFEDALLGQGWTAIKARQWNDCITVGQMLNKTSRKTILQCEGLLIQAYGHLLQKQYGNARTLLNEAAEKIKTAYSPSPDTLNYQKMQNESNRLSHNFFAEKVEKISLAGMNSSMVGQIDSMHIQQNEFIRKFDAFFNFSNEHYRSSFFARNIDKIREDIDYASATVQKIVGNSGTDKIIEEMQGQKELIDQQIEQLKKEMEELQKKAD